MLSSLTERFERVQRTISRATLVPFLVRLAIALCLFLAMTVAWPADLVFGRVGVLLLLAALYPAVAPRGIGPSLVIILAAAGWILDTTWYDARVALWRVLAIATLTYLGHTLAALAAVLPTDAVVTVDVVGTWLIRAAVVALISAVLTVVALGLASALAGSAFLIATLIGLAGAATATLLLGRLLHRP
ncbi:MAG: hypothetical protein QOE51_34 [Actinoplanes sp.]|jgi:hypothetical protein|nr:hypothetical protein [Actinoplanes sp.]